MSDNIPETEIIPIQPISGLEIKSKELSGKVSERQESVRFLSVASLLFTMAACVVGVAVFIVKIVFLDPSGASEHNIGIAVQLITLIWTSVVTLVSAALAFYFGSNKS